MEVYEPGTRCSILCPDGEKVPGWIDCVHIGPENIVTYVVAYWADHRREEITIYSYELIGPEEKLDIGFEPLSPAGNTTSTNARKAQAIVASRQQLENDDATLQSLSMLLDQAKVPTTACGGEGDAEVKINIFERLRWLIRDRDLLAKRPVTGSASILPGEHALGEADSMTIHVAEESLVTALEEANSTITKQRFELESLGNRWVERGVETENLLLDNQQQKRHIAKLYSACKMYVHSKENGPVQSSHPPSEYDAYLMMQSAIDSLETSVIPGTSICPICKGPLFEKVGTNQQGTATLGRTNCAKGMCSKSLLPPKQKPEIRKPIGPQLP